VRPLWPQLVAIGARLNVVASIVNYSILEQMESGDLMTLQVYGSFTFAHFAAKYNDPDLLKAAVAEHIDLDIRSFGFGSALHLACNNDNMQIAKLLVKCGAHTDSVAIDAW
jgi:hypothetical protein